MNNGPEKKKDLKQDWHDGSVHVNNRANSIETGRSAWIELFDEEDFKGNSTIYNAGDIANLDDRKRGDKDWQNAASSFILYDYPIANPQPIINKFVNGFKELYENNATYGDNFNMENEGDHFRIYSQDCHFQIDHPSIIQNHDKMNFELNLRHKKATTDDYCTVKFSMDTSGKLVGQQISIVYNMSEVKQVPDWAIQLADLTISGAEKTLKLTVDCGETIITEGVGAAAVPATNKIIGYAADTLTFAVDHVNIVLKAIFKIEEGSDGHSQSRILTETSISDAYKKCFDESFLLTENEVHYDDGTRNLPDISIHVVDAIQKSVATIQ